jgi:hypothetical protein
MKVSFWISSLLLVVSVAAQSARCEQVVFSEIMYHPAGTLPEFIEVYNNTATPMDIAEWRLTDGVDYTFPTFSTADPQRTFLKPFERILLCGVDEATLRASYSIPVSTRIYGPWTGNLDNAGERVTLKDKNGVVVCTVQYSNRGYWPVAADGTGHSLVLRNPDKKIDDGRNWTFSAQRGGSPGTEQASLAETPIASPEVNLSSGVRYVDYSDVWKYNDKNVDLGTAWRAPSYDDSGWPQGRGLLGYDTDPVPGPGIQTPMANAHQLTYYLRTQFEYTGPLQGVTLTVDQYVDDGAVYYLNGQELGRSHMPAGTVTFTTTSSQSHDAVEELAVITTSGSALVKGTNVLAVEVHQTTTTSTDVVFGMRLNIAVPVQSSLLINEVLPAAAGTGFVEIYNASSSPVNLRNDYLTDDPANLKKFRINQDLTLAAGGLGVVGFTESGLTVSSPLKIYLVASDGMTVLTAISASVPLDGRSIGRKPTGSSSWYLFTQPTRGSANLSQDRLTQTLAFNEVHFAGSGKVDWVELYNGGTSAISLDGLALCSRPDLTDKVALKGSVPAGGFASQDVSFAQSGGEATVFLLDGSGTVLCAAALRQPSAGDCLQAFPQGSSEWYGSSVSSRNAANDPARNTDVVINEIMYHPPSDERSGEFIELYNRGSSAVDLSGWRFTEGVDFVFPAGTSLSPAGYLVLAADAAWMTATYGAIPVIGDFQGQLSNSGEKIRLVDANGNLANQVDYKTGGSWPDLADGGGASLELINPSMDNSLASAWQASDETGKTSFQHYSYSDVYRQLNPPDFSGAVTDSKELHLYLVGDSEVVLQNIQLRQNGTGSNVITNGNRMSPNGSSATGWLAQGTHYATYLDGTDLHLVADGHGDNRPNRVEIDATGMQAGQTYEISFDARWVSGTSRLIAQTWDHSIATSISLPVPSDLGTPGAENSCFKALPGAQLDSLAHQPAVPSPGQNVLVTVHVVSQDPSPKVTLYYRLDNASGGGVWSNKTLYDDGRSGGDATAGDGIYTATLTEPRATGNIVQYYVLAIANEELTQVPSGGADRPSLYIVDNPMPAGDLRRMRLVISQKDTQALANGNSSVYGSAFPTLSNHYFNMTLIVNEKDVYEGCDIRANGSPWLRAGDLSRGKFKLPKDNLFRGKGKLSYDDDPIQGRMHHNRLTRYWLYLFGHPVGENEFIQLKVNSGASSIREEMEPVDNDMVDRYFANGSQGELYRIDDEWWFTDSWGRSYIPADWSYKPLTAVRPHLAAAGNTQYTDNSGRYHTEWIKRTRENEDDYSSLISFFKKVSSDTYTENEIERLIDPEATMKMFAVRGYIDDWDSFSMRRGKNGFFYRRPTDGRFMFFHWDSDLGFGSSGEYFYNATGEGGIHAQEKIQPYIERPYNARLFKHYLAVLVENYARNSARASAWLQAEEDASNQYTVAATYKNWFVSRETKAFSDLGTSRTQAFAITTNSGATISTAGNSVTLSGTAPARVYKVAAAGHPEAQLTWTDTLPSNATAGSAVWKATSTWTLSGILLHAGDNDLTVHALDDNGQILDQDTIRVNKSGDAPPVMAIKADATSWRMSVLDTLAMDVLDSNDPEGSLLTFTWAITPSDAQLDAPGQDKATVTFQHPGLYTVSVTGEDAAGQSATIQREIAAYAPEDSTGFKGTRLEPYWMPENLVLRPNYQAGPYYSLTEAPGKLLLAVLDDKALPLASANPEYPVLWRPVPATADWAFLSKVTLVGQVFADYGTGLVVAMAESGGSFRYAFGIEDGNLLTVRRITASGTSSVLKSVVWTSSQAELRIRRTAGKLFFEQRTNEVWTAVFSMDAATSTALKAGLFIATDASQIIKAGFEYATLVDPASAGSALRQGLRLSEIMYNPTGGSDYEFVELVNIGSNTLDLTGVHFTAGIDYTFGPLSLSPGQCVVVASDPASFGQRYGTASGRVLNDGFSGKLDNAGETIELSDRNGEVILSVTYGAAAPWPTEANGTGRSLEVIDPAKSLNDPGNWRASSDAFGSPGRL